MKELLSINDLLLCDYLLAEHPSEFMQVAPLNCIMVVSLISANSWHANTHVCPIGYEIMQQNGKSRHGLVTHFELRLREGFYDECESLVRQAHTGWYISPVTASAPCPTKCI